MSPKRRIYLSLVFACICLSKSLLIKIKWPKILGKECNFHSSLSGLLDKAIVENPALNEEKLG